MDSGGDRERERGALAEQGLVIPRGLCAGGWRDGRAAPGGKRGRGGAFRPPVCPPFQPQSVAQNWRCRSTWTAGRGRSGVWRLLALLGAGLAAWTPRARDRLSPFHKSPATN